MRCIDCHIEVPRFVRGQSVLVWEYDAGNCMRAIDAYMAAWERGETVDEELTHNKAVGREAREFEAARRPHSPWRNDYVAPPAAPEPQPATVEAAPQPQIEKEEVDDGFPF